MSVQKIENPSAFRGKIQLKINDILNNELYSRNLERGVYNYSLNEAKNRKVIKKWDNPHFVKIYLDRLRSIYINLQNPSFIKHIKDNALQPHIVAFMSHQEMQPEKWKELIEEKSKRDMNKYETNIEAATDTFVCRKCRANKCTYYALQTRSSDEPMTIYVTCLMCGYRWKTS
jgi:transcription elongation factor S-II